MTVNAGKLSHTPVSLTLLVVLHLSYLVIFHLLITPNYHNLCDIIT